MPTYQLRNEQTGKSTGIVNPTNKTDGLTGLVPLKNDVTGLNPTIEDINRRISAISSQLKRGEPAVLSSEGGEAIFEKNVAPQVNRAREAQKRRDEMNAEKAKQKESVIPEDLLEDDDEGLTDEEIINKRQLDLYDRQRKQAEDVYDSLIASYTDMGQIQSASLKHQLEMRRAEFEELNKRELATWETQFIRSGQAEYSPGMTADFLSSKEREGLQRIKNLDLEYNTALAEINANIANKKLLAASEKAESLASIEQNILDVMKENVKAAREANEKIMERKSLIITQKAIIDLYEQGITDPAQILDYINYTQDGELVSDVDLEEIDETLKYIQTPTTDLTGTSSDLRTFAALYPDLKQGTEDFRKKFNQFVVTQAALKRKPETTTLAGNPGNYTPSELKKLRDVGIDPNDIEVADDYLYSGVEPEGESEDINQKFVEVVQSYRDEFNLSRKDAQKEIERQVRSQAKIKSGEDIPPTYRVLIERVMDEVYPRQSFFERGKYF